MEKGSALAKLKKEFLELLPPTIFFFVALHIVGLVRALMVKGTGLPAFSSVQIAVGALIFGKAVLLADMLPRSTASRKSRSPTTLPGRR